MSGIDSKRMVIICRSPGDWKRGVYEADKICDVNWGRVSGGIQKLQNGWSIYGNIPYEDAEEIVACSGRHSFATIARICVTASGNKDNPQYKAAYYSLVEKADEKRGWGIASGCPKGKPICTKRIREIMSEVKQITRGELKEKLDSEGYARETINESIKNLHWQEILEFEGDSRSHKQIIRMG